MPWRDSPDASFYFPTQPFDEITAIRRTSPRRVFGAVEVVYGPHRVHLTSFWDRDKAATALLDAWLASGAPAAGLFMDAMEKLGNVASVGPAASAVPQRGDAASSDSGEPGESGESGESEAEPHDAHAAATAAHEQAEATPDDAAPSPGPTAEHLGSLLDAARQTQEPLLSPPAPVVPSQLGGGDAPAPIPQLLPSACAAAPPAPPAEGAAPLPVAPGGEVEAELDCSPAEFFALFLADGSRFTEAFRSARGEREVAVQPWRDDTGGAACRRVVTFRAPLDAMKGMRLPGIPHSTRIREEQRCAFHDCAGSGEGAPALVVLDCSSAQLDIPYGESFVLESRLQLRARDGGVPKCAASVAFKVRWLKTPPRMPGIKGKIESQSREASAEAFRTMLAMAQGYLARWQQAAAAGAKRAPKKARSAAGGMAVSNPRLEAALEKLDAATAEDIRAALGLPPATGQAVTEAAASADASIADEASSSPRSKAAELAALRQSLVPSSAVAFGAVVDALQLAAAALNEAHGVAAPKADGGVGIMQPGVRRAAVALTLLAAMLLAAALSYLMGLRRGSLQAALPVLPCDHAAG